MNPEDYMKMALKEAEKAFRADEVPVGAVIVDPVGGAVVAKAHNLGEHGKDAAAHAELEAMRRACRKLKQNRLWGLDLYVTLEPCTMCAAAASLMRIRKIRFGAEDVKGGAVANGVRFYQAPTCHHRPEVEGGLLADEASALLKAFFRRQAAKAVDKTINVWTGRCHRVKLAHHDNGGRTAAMEFKEVVFTKVSPETRRHNRRFFERHVRRMFIKYLAYTNQFDGVLNDREIEEAKLGHLPADLDVHHIFPIAGSESEDVNSFTNLTVLHKTTHIRINREIFAPQLKEIDRMPEGAKLLIRLPLFEPVDAEGILRARTEATRRGLQKGDGKLPPALLPASGRDCRI